MFCFVFVFSIHNYLFKSISCWWFPSHFWKPSHWFSNDVKMDESIPSRPLMKPLPCWTPSTVTPTKTAPWSCSCSVTIWQWVFYLLACLLCFILSLFCSPSFLVSLRFTLRVKLNWSPFQTCNLLQKYKVCRPNKAILLGRTCNISIKLPSRHKSELNVDRLS